jgi:tRNA A-37 threonylcarbamoyl transferase component Bud32
MNPLPPAKSRKSPYEVFHRRRSLRAVLWTSASLSKDVVERLWSNPDQCMAEGTMLKDGDRCTVVRLDLDGRAMVLKRYNLKGAFHTAVHGLMRSRARWCWRSGRMLMEAGIRTPQPLAMLEERRAGFLRSRSYLLTEFVPGLPLRTWIELDKHEAKDLHAIVAQFARAWRDLNELRLGHGDMKSTNFIVDPEGQLWFIDLDGMRIYPQGPLLRAERRKDIARFMRNWQDHPEVAAAFRARIGTG